jgi:hypothetical protein
MVPILGYYDFTESVVNDIDIVLLRFVWRV